MSTERCQPHPIEHNGTNQGQRMVRALAPADNPVDGRDLADLIGYAERYASVLQFWNQGKSEDPADTDFIIRDGDWQDFINQDVSALVARIRRTDITALRSRFQQLRQQLEQASGTNLAASFDQLYGEFTELATRLDRWYRAAPETLTLHRELEGWIASTLGELMRSVVAQAARARVVDPRVTELELQGLHGLWQLAEVLPDASQFGHGGLNHSADQAAALEQLAQAHGQLMQVLEQLLSRTPELMQQTLLEYPQHQPHMALLLTFLQLFGHAQQHLNRLTEQHLNFYYQRVLGLQAGTAVADQANLVLEPAKHLDQNANIAADTAFKAGKDTTGVELIYASDHELVLNQTQLDPDQGLKSVFVDIDRGQVTNIHAATFANSADGQGADLENDDGSWQTFGSTTTPYAILGFAVASPMLLLGEGDRRIWIRFDLDHKLNLPADISEADMAKELRLNITAQASGEKGWLTLDINEVQFESNGQPCLTFRLHLSATAEPITGFNAELLDGGFDTGHPVLRFTLNNEGLPAADLDGEEFIPEPPETLCEPHTVVQPGTQRVGIVQVLGHTLPLKPQKILNFEDSMAYFAPGMLVRSDGKLYRSVSAIEKAGFRPANYQSHWAPQRISYPYRYLQGMEIRGLQIDVKVEGVRNLILENDQGLLNPAKPFMPFGPVPKIGSSWLIGSPEVFSKPLDEVRLELNWNDLPQHSFPKHYLMYGVNAPTSNQHHTYAASLLQGGDWINIGTGALFDDFSDPDDPDDGANRPATERCFQFKNPTQAPLLQADNGLGTFKQYRAGMRQGFMQLQLDSHDFSHSLYSTKLTEAAMGQNPALIPNPPYTPLVSTLTLSYKAHQHVNFRGKSVDDFATREAQLFQIWPFGQREIWPIAAVKVAGPVPVERRLLPHFDLSSELVTDPLTNPPAAGTAEGSLYVGFQGLDLSAGAKNLSILVQVAEGSADPEQSVQPLVWSYLVNDVWHDFKTSEILADGSNGLLRSGIIRLAMPKTMTDKNRVLPAGRHWIKVSVRRHTVATCRLIALHTQALTVRLQDRGNDPNHLASPLAAGSIGKLVDRVATVKKVTQPYASFDGRIAESSDEFTVRVSERLRHKGRAISLFDYERLVLQAFADIYKVKCVNHANRHQQQAPGHVWVVVVPDLRNRNAVDPLKPRASLDTLDQIHDFLAGYASDFVRLDVSNPFYQEIRVKFQVRFHPGVDQGHYLDQLVTDIQNHLSPWLHDATAEISFGGRIHRSKVLHFVEQCDYVDFITDFRMDQREGSQLDSHWRLDVEEAIASNAGTVLVSAAADEYQIGVDVHSCDDPEPEFDNATKEPISQSKTDAQSGPQLLGNTGSRELHDLNNLTPMCHIDRIDSDRQYRFYTIAEARKMGYDLCGHCFGRDRSTR